jgi:6-phospho-beta-glucosidase
MAADDVIEIGCWIDFSGIHPEPVGTIRGDHLLLMQTVKQYERLAARAILERDRALAVQALTIHPLVGSYPLAEKLVDAFLKEHAALVGAWH